MLDISAQVTALAERATELTETRPRVLVALAGAPAAGKSTLAAAVHRRLRDQRVPAEVVPLDGFLLDTAVLDARGLRQRKGAPETFDSQGFLHLVRRLKTGGEVVAPIFDRARDIAIAGAQVVPADCRVVICEGGYLLFDEAPWRELLPLWDLTARVDVPLRELRARLIQRWLSHGLSRAAATRRAESNDVPNAERIIGRELPAQFLLAMRH
ncbi:sugar transporter [Rubellimicrobium roseum]|uniref:Sugar transporter n=1 Tax=Rubellimicrobium roseum TaxID=687525 RepID=A0A5C4NAJ9_9RHOB|nr:sugar transporter [Rubellimicrobium roseum]TNC69128.1 sugar transporter [Rubellimicrobium roseum]